MNLYNWEQLPAEQMNPQVVRKVVHTEQMTIARLNIQKGAVVPEHAHINEQVANVERGALKFHIGGEDVVVSAGESLVIPPNVPHGVVALEDCVVTDVFTPRREDWIKGDDSYLRR
jgi:quercetin dioxygenase-like cupin family protein